MRRLATNKALQDNHPRTSCREIAGILCHGSPWISGPLVGQSCPTVQTAAGRDLRVTIAGIGDPLVRALRQGHGGLSDANCEVVGTSTDPQEIHHDQNSSLQDHEDEATFALTANLAIRTPHAEQSSLVREPPHASLWQGIRETCDSVGGPECGYPFCPCDRAEAELAAIEAEAKSGDAG